MTTETIDTTTGISTMTKIVRLVGAGLLVASASTFMIQQWDASNDLVRYLTLLSHTALLAAAGFFCGIKIKESRGARTFLGLVLVSVPVHFAVLGGLIYSQFSLDGPTLAIPVHHMWTAKSPAEALGLLGLGVATLLPMTAVAMAAFARSHMKPLTLAYLAMNLLLLVPVRGTDGVSLLVVIGASFLAASQRGLFWKQPLLANTEGRFARLLLLIPLGVIVGRTLYLYDVTEMFAGIGLTVIGVLLFGGAAMVDPRGWQRAAHGLGIAFTVSGWMLIAFQITVGDHVPNELVLPLFGLPLSIALAAMSAFTEEAGPHYRRAAALLALGAVGGNLIGFSGPVPGLLCLTVGIVTMIFGVSVKQKLVAVAGAIALIAGAANHFRHLIRVESLSHWAVLSGIGALLILGASLFERRSEAALKALAAYRKRLAAWDF